jgi:hypothetical protein
MYRGELDRPTYSFCPPCCLQKNDMRNRDPKDNWRVKKGPLLHRHCHRSRQRHRRKEGHTTFSRWAANTMSGSQVVSLVLTEAAEGRVLLHSTSSYQQIKVECLRLPLNECQWDTQCCSIKIYICICMYISTYVHIVYILRHAAQQRGQRLRVCVHQHHQHSEG